MISYKFTIGKKGQLTCYKSDNTLNKYTGKKALDKLEHIKDFSYHTFDSLIKEPNNKKCFCMVFSSNNHIVTFEDISSFQRRADFSIEGILRELISIVKENAIKNEMLQQQLMEQYNIDANKTKLICTALFAGAIIAANNLPIHKIEHSTKRTIPLEQSIVNEVHGEIKEDTNVEMELITRYVEKEDYPAELITYCDYNTLTQINDYSLVIDQDNVASFITEDTWNGEILNSYDGFIECGPSGAYETYYDADVINPKGMDICVEYMRDLGYSEEEYPYYIREDGVRMFGDYVMVAANVDILPKGTIIETTLGTAMVVDACENAEELPNQVDIAVNWTKNLTLKKQ